MENGTRITFYIESIDTVGNIGIKNNFGLYYSYTVIDHGSDTTTSSISSDTSTTTITTNEGDPTLLFFGVSIGGIAVVLVLVSAYVYRMKIGVTNNPVDAESEASNEITEAIFGGGDID